MLLNVPSSLQAFPQWMLFAPGICPPRWQVSGRTGGARISPEYSCGLRTYTSAAERSGEAFWAYGKNARMEKSGDLAEYVLAAILGTSVESSRPSTIHFL